MIIIRFRKKVGLNFECVLYIDYIIICALVYVCVYVRVWIMCCMYMK